MSHVSNNKDEKIVNNNKVILLYSLAYPIALTFVHLYKMRYATTGNILHYDCLLYDDTVIIAVRFVALKKIPFHIPTLSDNPGNNKIHTSEQ